MKRFISILLSVLLMIITTATVFAESSDSELYIEEIYSSLETAKQYVLNCAKNYKEYFIYNDGIIGDSGYPQWSDKSKDNYCTIYDNVELTINDCKTIEEVISLEKLLEKAVDEMCVESGELEWILNYMKKDYESENYYDEDTSTEIKNIYECAQAAYTSGDEEQMHISYIYMRNLLNKLCLYNQVAGDVNQDGKLNIDDISLMQKNLAGIVKFNNSQNYLSCFHNNSTVDLVTNWQKELSNINNRYIKLINSEIIKLSNTIDFDINKRYQQFNMDTEHVNYLFFDEVHKYRWDPWWIN